MEQELRRVYYDPELGVEACLFQGIDQGFPEHFHTYYVIGTMDRGSREVTIAGETLRLAPGELVFFQPGEPHACRPVGEERLDWRGLHVPQEVMERAAEAVTGRQFAPHFTPSVLPGSELTSLFREVWELVAGEQGELRREEAFLLLVGRLLERCGGCPRPPEEVRPEVRAVCDYLEAHCDRRIEQFLAQGLPSLLPAYRARSATLDRTVRVLWEGREAVGRAVDVAEDGSLLVEIGGRVVPVCSGEASVRGLYGYR